MSGASTVLRLDGKCFLVVTHKGLLRQVFVPIRLKCVLETPGIPLGAIVFADAVITHSRYHWLYLVNQKVYPHFHFSIQVNW